MSGHLTYRHTLKACCFSNFFQAIGVVFPILLIPLRQQCGMTYTQFGILVSLNFMTQVASDVFFSKLVDRCGFRRFVVTAPLLSSLGLLLFAQAESLFPNRIFMGFCLGTVIFAGAAGLNELLMSPMVDTMSTDEDRERNMSLLHACYPWGQIAVILTTTAMLSAMGAEKWQNILRIWAVIPLICSLIFCLVPIKNREHGEGRTGVRELFKTSAFWLIISAIVAGGAAEVTMGQWVSAFVERGLQLPKALGDMVGMCGFAVTLAFGRTLYGIKGNRYSIQKVMTAGSFLAFLLYLAAALSMNPLVGLMACGLTGLSVSLLWPGCIILGSRRFPLAGASMFALLSAAGDVGASLGSSAVGRIADSIAASVPGWMSAIPLPAEQLGLRSGILIASVFPLACGMINIILAKKENL